MLFQMNDKSSTVFNLTSQYIVCMCSISWNWRQATNANSHCRKVKRTQRIFAVVIIILKVLVSSQLFSVVFVVVFVVVVVVVYIFRVRHSGVNLKNFFINLHFRQIFKCNQWLIIILSVCALLKFILLFSFTKTEGDEKLYGKKCHTVPHDHHNDWLWLKCQRRQQQQKNEVQFQNDEINAIHHQHHKSNWISQTKMIQTKRIQMLRHPNNGSHAQKISTPARPH